MPLFMLDTNVVSVAMRGGNAAIDSKLAALAMSDWCISAITRAELKFGLEKRPGNTRLATTVESFLKSCVCVPWDERAADAHATLRATLQRAGTPIGTFDEMIAAHALSLGTVLVTDNVKHFERVALLRVENWQRLP